MIPNPWQSAALARAGRPNAETRPERLYRLACLTMHVPVWRNGLAQMHIGRYRPDFYHPQWQLIVEVDGPTHGTMRGRAKDYVRDQALLQKGYRIYHLDWRAVERDPQAALACVIAYAQEYPERKDQE